MFAARYMHNNVLATLYLQIDVVLAPHKHFGEAMEANEILYSRRGVTPRKVSNISFDYL
jgi:hypothetical protein